MNKFLLILCLSAIIAVGFLACNGMSPLSSNGDGTFGGDNVTDEGDCLDVSGEYEVTFVGCGGEGMALFTVTHTESEITIAVNLGEGCDAGTNNILTGTVDCEGNFTVTGFFYDDCAVTLAGSLALVSGTLTNNDCWDCPYTWSSEWAEGSWCDNMF